MTKDGPATGTWVAPLGTFERRIVLRGKRAVYKGEKYKRMEGFWGCMASRGKNLVNREVGEIKEKAMVE